ncbi:MAG: hypothetical protein CML68_23410 [Rhodobacteraceae bacterium]|nr:hypothetical protein [Paracoccaceae bacterium]
MRHKAIRMTIGLGVMALGAHEVSGQQAAANCAPRPMVLERLTDSYGETRQSIGLGSNNAVVEVFASDQTGSWTITVTRPDGTTCLVAAGNAFERIDEIRPTGDPA